MATLSVITLTKNEEHNITECLSGVRWADELIVIDSGSVDRTVEKARAFTDKVLASEWKGYGATKNDGLKHAKGDWVLWLDADERVPPGLADEIRSVIASSEHRVAAYSVARRAFFLGKWIRHSGWYPGRVVRLFRRDRGSFSASHVHEHLEINGETGALNNDLLHYTDPNLYHYFAKFNTYTSLAAKDLLERGESFSTGDVLFRPAFMFVKMFLFRRGFLDGMHGFLLALCSSAYVFVKYAKLWEISRRKEQV